MHSIRFTGVYLMFKSMSDLTFLIEWLNGKLEYVLVSHSFSFYVALYNNRRAYNSREMTLVYCQPEENKNLNCCLMFHSQSFQISNQVFNLTLLSGLKIFPLKSNGKHGSLKTELAICGFFKTEVKLLGSVIPPVQ